MLLQLSIKNYALIRQLEIKPSPQLNVITGETGAGKSIMLGAVGLLLGNRADAKVLWDENEKCVVEGVFDVSAYRLKSLFENNDLDYQDQTFIRREIIPGGKSRAFVNDTPVTLEIMRKIGNKLMDVHSQHETLDLGNNLFQLELIDAFAGNQKIKDSYSLLWKTFTQAKSAYESLVKESDELRQESDYVKFQLDELVKARLEEGEQERLEAELKVMEHAEEIKTQLIAVVQQLSQSELAVNSVLTTVRNQLNNIASYSADYQKLLERIESVRIELDDIADEAEREESGIEFDAERIEEVKDRLSTLYQLMQKHRVKELKELLALQESLQVKFDKTSNLDEALHAAKATFEKAQTELKSKAEELSKTRQKVFNPLCKQIVELLKDLGIPNAVLKMEHQSVSPTANGADVIELLFTANKGVEPRPLAQVASGGEFSRLMFSIKYVMAEKTALPTLILDEIDSGISGEIAIQLGKMMKEMAQRHQLVTITHLPQIAAKGDTHYFVYKDDSSKKTVSMIRSLTKPERVDEIAKMIAGSNPSALALENARELMAS
ncbi:MAG: DNA repair protein RecN [Cyclobacteriaceae bacterium]|jgi:DNA repair protein RecN (Recombination protein N)|nr:DNA repair protein RecN [Flammeovirgaceae bacterium]